MLPIEQNIATILFKIALSAFLGFLLGMERNIAHKEAGIRTFFLITLGSTLFTILGADIAISAYGTSTIDPTRVVAQIVSGVGFLGAGMILFHEQRLRGLTTAAAVWFAAAVGAAVGMGAYVTAWISTLLAVLLLILFLKLEDRLNFKNGKGTFKDTTFNP